MILKLTDNTQFYISKEQAHQIELAVSKGNEHVLLPGLTMIKTKNIMSILPGSDPTAVSAARQLEEGRRTATDEGIKAAREKLQSRLDLIQRKREIDKTDELIRRATTDNRPGYLFKNKRIN